VNSNEANDSLPIGQIFEGKYKILRELGRGGFGMVYLAYQEPMDRYVALKVLRPGIGLTAPSAKERFLREVRIISKLKHPNTVTIHDFGDTVNGGLYMTLEYVDGDTLKDLLKREFTLDGIRAAHIARQIAKSLSEAHRLGIVHRDLKPANIMVMDLESEKDFVKVLDFGVARLLDSSNADLTSAGLPEGERELIGTPRYMSPEQVRGEQLAGASDVYSLGLMLYEMVAGEPAVMGDTTMGLISQQISPEALRLPMIGSFDPMLHDIVRISTAKAVHDRFQTAEQLADALEQFLAKERSGHHALGEARPGSGWNQNSGWVQQSGYQQSGHGSGQHPSAQYPAQQGGYAQGPQSGQYPTAHPPTGGYPPAQQPVQYPQGTQQGQYPQQGQQSGQYPQQGQQSGQYPQQGQQSGQYPQQGQQSGQYPQQNPYQTLPPQPNPFGTMPQQNVYGTMPPQQSPYGTLPPGTALPNAPGIGSSGALPIQGNSDFGDMRVDRNAEYDDFQGTIERTPLDRKALRASSGFSNEIPSLAELPPPPMDERPFQPPPELAKPKRLTAEHPAVVRPAVVKRDDDLLSFTLEVVKILVLLTFFSVVGYFGFLIFGAAIAGFTDGPLRVITAAGVIGVVALLAAAGETGQKERFRVVTRTADKLIRIMISSIVFTLALALVVSGLASQEIVRELRTDPNWFLTGQESKLARGNRDLSYGVADGIATVMGALGLFDEHGSGGRSEPHIVQPTRRATRPEAKGEEGTTELAPAKAIEEKKSDYVKW
jgi:serine/threonine protein kinase